MILLRRKNIRSFISAAVSVLTVWLLVYGCSFAPSDDSGGTGSEIVGKTEYPDTTSAQKTVALPKLLTTAGLPVIGGRIFVYPRAFIPDTSWATFGALPRVYTDTGGWFRVEDVPRGVVVVEANDGNGKGMVKTVTVDQDSTTYDAGIFTLQKTGAITIQTHTSLPGSVRFYVSVKGTRCVVRGTSTDINITLDGIPSGMSHTINIRVYEPVHLEKDFTNVNVPAGGIQALPDYIIQ